MKYKYLITHVIKGKPSLEIISLMDQIANHTDLEPPYKKLLPHITFVKPIVNVEEELILNLVQSMVLQMRPTNVTLGGLRNFGKQYIVLPVHPTKMLADFYSGINKLVALLPEYEHGVYDDENTLHVTVAEKTSNVFDEAWPQIKKLETGEINITIDSVFVYKKPISGKGGYTKIADFEIPK